jgi:hypothetical protein
MSRIEKLFFFRILPALVVITVGTGVWGWMQGLPEWSFDDRSFGDALYLSLLAFGGDDSYAPVPNIWVNVARYTGIAASAIAIFALVYAVLQKQMMRFFARLRSGHTVIIGTSSFAINYVLEDVRTPYRHERRWDRFIARLRWFFSGRKVTVIDAQENLDQHEEALRAGGVFAVDTLPEKISEAAHLLGKDPTRILLGSANDMRNIDLAILMKDLRPDAKLVLSISDETLARDLDTITPELARAEIVSDAQVAARALLTALVPDELAALRRQERVHVVLVGFGAMGLAIAEEIALRCTCEIGPGTDWVKRPLITIFDTSDARATKTLDRMRPGLRRAADIVGPSRFDAMDCGLVAGTGEGDPLCALEAEGKPGITAIVVCAGEDSNNMQLALRLREIQTTQQRLRAPIFARIQSSNSILPSPLGDVTRGLYLFGGNQYSKRDLQLQDIVRRLAKMLYDGWRANNNPTAPTWEKLSFAEQRTNTRAALSAEQVLRNAGLVPPDNLGLADLAGYPPSIRDIQNNPEEILRLSVLEHNRWSNERFAEGWTHARIRNNARRQHDCLVPFHDLSEKMQANDTRNVETILAHSLRQGEGPRPYPDRGRLWRQRLRVGVMGKMTFDPADALAVRVAMAAWFRALTPGIDHYSLEVMTPNAPGSDRMLAALALEEWYKLTGRKGQLICYQVGRDHDLDVLSMTQEQRGNDKLREALLAASKAQSAALADAPHFGQVTVDITPPGVFPADWHTKDADPAPFMALCEQAAADIADSSTHIFAYLAQDGGTMTRAILHTRHRNSYTIVPQSSSADKSP